MKKAVEVSFGDTCANCDPRNGIGGEAILIVRGHVDIIRCWTGLYGETESDPAHAGVREEPGRYSGTVVPWVLDPDLRDSQKHVVLIHHWQLPRPTGTGSEPYAVRASLGNPQRVTENFWFDTRDRRLPEPWGGDGGPGEEHAYTGYCLVTVVEYTLAGCWAWLPCGGKRTEVACRHLHFTNPFPLTSLCPEDPFLQTAPDDVECGMMTAWGGLGRRGVVHCHLHLPFTGLVRGQRFPVTLTIHNSSRSTVRSASLHLIQEITMTTRLDPTLTKTIEEELSICRLESVGPHSVWRRLVLGLHVPHHGLTNGSFVGSLLLRVRFLVRVKVNVFLHPSLVCQTVCHVGSERGDVTGDTPTVNQERLNIYRVRRYSFPQSNDSQPKTIEGGVALIEFVTRTVDTPTSLKFQNKEALKKLPFNVCTPIFFEDGFAEKSSRKACRSSRKSNLNSSPATFELRQLSSYAEEVYLY